MADPRFSIVIVAYGRRPISERCLESLKRSLGPALGCSAELVLVDNNSPDDTAELFDSWREKATVVALPTNRNFAGGCNAGAAAARGEVLVFLNNDTIVEPGALEALARQAGEPGIGAAGLRLLYLDGTLQHAGVGMIRVPSGYVVPHHLFHHQDGELPAARVTYELDAVTAACLAIRRDLFTSLGGYDEGYVNGWEDVDLCLRARMTGHRIVYRGDLWLWHDEGQSRGRVRGADANAARFYGRWASLLDSDDALVRSVFGGRLPAPRAARHTESAVLTVSGTITGVSGTSAEARGLIAAAGAAGLTVAARETTIEMVQAILSDAEHADLNAALARSPTAGAPLIHLSPPTHPPAAGILRLGRFPRELPGETTIWVPSPRLGAQLVDAGIDESRVEWLAPCVPAGPAGPGGAGVLAILPGDDQELAAQALSALSGFAGQRIHVLPAAASLPLLALVSERLPEAEVLEPCPSDALFRQLASNADVVLCADTDDAYDRRALTAAGAGAVPVCAAGGPADAVLGAGTVLVEAFEATALTAALRRAHEVAGDRPARAATILERCAAHTVGERLTELLARAHAISAA